ncbi:UNVERIFIED_CONTAM: hypothetical protein Sangu_0741000 [Sesamum angustifolium]|uniref:Uncharacterized protein n=1 Tax=Sesamum angustifolium TaxID=2727405 RepID=A0AAW2PUX7_9LAMI
MALWIPSCCSNNESSLRRPGGGATSAFADADRLFPKCFATILKLPTLLPPDNFLGDKFAGAGAREGGGVNDSVNFAFSFCLFETFRYKGLISFRYLETASLDDFSDDIS